MKKLIILLVVLLAITSMSLGAWADDPHDLPFSIDDASGGTIIGDVGVVGDLDVTGTITASGSGDISTTGSVIVDGDGTASAIELGDLQEIKVYHKAPGDATYPDALFFDVSGGGDMVVIGGKIDLWDNVLKLGSNGGASTRTNATNKFAYITAPHRTNAEEDIALMYLAEGISPITLNVGGGSASYNAITQFNIWLASDNTTTTGTATLFLTRTALALGLQDGSGTAIEPTRLSGWHVFTFDAANDDDNTADLGTDSFTLPDPTTHVEATCFVHGTDTVLCQWLCDTDGNCIEIQDNEGGGAYTAGTGCHAALGNDGIALVGAAGGSVITNELGQSETITCKSFYD